MVPLSDEASSTQSAADALAHRSPISIPATMPALVSQAGERADIRLLEFFAANIRNPNTRRPYAHAVGNFMN